MGKDIKRDTFEEREYTRFAQRLEENLSALQDLLDQPGFGVGPATMGAELELCLVDDAGRPLPRNQAVRVAAADHRVTVELNRFNLELNASPVRFAEHPFTALGDELDLLLDRVADGASAYGARLVLIGILPTLRRSDLGPEALTDLRRYSALNNRLRQVRHGPIRIRIAGIDPLELVSNDVAVEGANTSFQVHLRVNPAEFTQTYNAVQLAIAPVLAVAGNSPTFLGHQLWEETRIALCKQSIDDRDTRGPRRRIARMAFGTRWMREGPIQLFAESVRLHQPLLPVFGASDPQDGDDRRQPPPLDELRLHHGTVWRWNRAIYDPGCGGHLRIEMRALPAGPTVIDMLANAAFLIGLSLWLAGQDPRWTYQLSFERAEHNFYRAAKHGLTAQLTWPFAHGGGPRTGPASVLVAELLPLAREGLVRADIAPAEAKYLLDVIAGRIATGQTGATWQRQRSPAPSGGSTGPPRWKRCCTATSISRALANRCTRGPLRPSVVTDKAGVVRWRSEWNPAGSSRGVCQERTEVPVAGVSGWRCWYRGIARRWEAAMPGQTSPAAARESIRATRVHPSPTDLRYQVALQRYISALSPSHRIEEQATHSTWLWNANHLLVRDMMTTNVVTTRPSTPFKTVVGLLGAHRISAVPVVDEANKVVGIVSESDLLAKVVAGDRSGQRLPGTRSDRRAVRARTAAETAADLMTAEPITVRADKSLSEAARMAAAHHVRRLPVVVEDGTLVGIITRSDMLAVFLRDDDAIRRHLVEHVLPREFDLDPASFDVTVEDGIVTLRGQVPRRLLTHPLIEGVRRTAGVIAVHDHLTYAVDDSVLPPRQPLP